MIWYRYDFFCVCMIFFVSVTCFFRTHLTCVNLFSGGSGRVHEYFLVQVFLQNSLFQESHTPYLPTLKLIVYYDTPENHRFQPRNYKDNLF